MSAILQVYNKSTCAATEELSIAGLDYDLTIGPITGLDGDSGDRTDVGLYVKNTGNVPAIDVTLFKDNDTADFAEFRLGSDKNYVKDQLFLGNILPGQVVDVYLRVTVAAGTPAMLVSPNLTFKFKSLP